MARNIALENKAEELLTIEDQIAELRKAAEAIRAELKDMVKDSGETIVKSGVYRVHFVEYTKTVFNTQECARAHSDIYARYSYDTKTSKFECSDIRRDREKAIKAEAARKSAEEAAA